MEQPTFEARWAQLEPQLRAALARRRIPFDQREDILQETALRLLRNWDRVREESLWAFALTVTLNIVRDEARKKERHERSASETPITPRDPEHEAIVRLELDRVRIALSSMSERQRTILLGEIGEAMPQASTPALKMARMRARRRLRSLTEDASGLVALPLMKVRRWIHPTDTTLATTAASWAARFGAVTTVAAISVPAIGMSASTTTGTTGLRTGDVRDVVVERAPAGSSRAIAMNDAMARKIGSRSGSVRGPRASADEVNKHFGVIHKEDDSITIGGEKRVGPYGVDHAVAQSVAGSDLGAEVEARYEVARCTNRFLQRPHEPCGRPGRLRGRIKAVAGDVSHESELAPSTPTN